MENKYENVHWADNFAKRAIDATPDAKEYIVESGVTPSGIIHVGHFREAITMELVRRALEDKGENGRFFYSWDSYDAMRKVPKNLPKEYEKYLRLPLNKVPDPDGCHESFAHHYMANGEEALTVFDFPIEFQYQHELQTSGIYAEGIKKILNAEKTGKIQKILNKYRHKELVENWTSVTLFCEECGKDTTKILNYNGEYSIEYECECNHKNTIDFRKTPIVKLLFRTDWPMRWDYYNVNVEGGGKDYATPGSPWFSGNDILSEIFNKPKLIGPFHNFVGMKGMDGKISSSKGDGATTSDLLEVYTPELVLFLFAGTRPNAEFDISFDLDVIKIYEDFDKLERVYYGLEEETNEKKLATLKRTYELSMVGRHTKDRVPQKEIPIQIGFRHLTTVAQACDFDFEKVASNYKDDIKTDFDKNRLKERFECAKNWLKIYAPDDMRFSIKKLLTEDEISNLKNNEKEIVKEVVVQLEKTDNSKELFAEFRVIAEAHSISIQDFFKMFYNLIIGKDKGPRLAELMVDNKSKVLDLLKQV